MSSKHLRGDLNYAWPTAEIAVMGAKGAVEIIFRQDMNSPDKIAERTKEYEARFANPFVAASKGFIDEVIPPHSTRRRIGLGLRKLRYQALENARKQHDNLPLKSIGHSGKPKHRGCMCLCHNLVSRQARISKQN